MIKESIIEEDMGDYNWTGRTTRRIKAIESERFYAKENYMTGMWLVHDKNLLPDNDFYMEKKSHVLKLMEKNGG